MSNENKNYEEMYKSLKELHDSTNETVIQLQKENSNLKDEIILLLDKLENCQKALDINKEVMKNALIRQNELAATYGDEIRILKAKINIIKGQ